MEQGDLKTGLAGQQILMGIHNVYRYGGIFVFLFDKYRTTVMQLNNSSLSTEILEYASEEKTN